jgi:protein arginine kinase activator
MKWKCMFCNKPATIHIEKLVNLKQQKAHLCERCAKERNLLPDTPGPQIDLKALMNLLMPLQVPSEAGSAAATEAGCTNCGLSYAAFKAEGRLGCEHDYEAFRPVLEPLLERIQRAVVHVGKTPVAYRSAKIEGLRIQMKAAVAVEDYEQAARLRDLIRQQEAEGTAG